MCLGGCCVTVGGWVGGCEGKGKRGRDEAGQEQSGCGPAQGCGAVCGMARGTCAQCCVHPVI